MDLHITSATHRSLAAALEQAKSPMDSKDFDDETNVEDWSSLDTQALWRTSVVTSEVAVKHPYHRISTMLTGARPALIPPSRVWTGPGPVEGNFGGCR